MSVTGSDFSDNYHNPGHGWGELPARGGILCENVRQSVLRKNRANRVWDGLHLIDSDDWNLSDKRQIRFWIQVRNPNLPGFQNAGPVVRLIGRHGQVELRPTKDANLLNDPPFSEARWLWMPVTIPLAGDANWQCKTTGAVTLDRIDAISFSFDSWGGDPFTVWLDGLTVE